MDGERKINISEGVPLNSGVENIILNTCNTRDAKLNSHDGTVIHLKTEKPSDLGLHINTTVSVASSKKIKLLFVINFLLSVICMAISCSIAFYYWNEMISMRTQLDRLKDHLMVQNPIDDRVVSSALVAPLRPQAEARRARMDTSRNDDITQSTRKYYVEDFGEDMLLVDSKKKNLKQDNNPPYDLPIRNKEMLIAQFNGARPELNLGSDPIVGPWVRDNEVSSKNSDDKIVLDTNYVTIKEGGIYFIYAQLVYLTKMPNCFYIWAHQNLLNPRLLATCASGDVSSPRSLAKSQMSCSAHAVARLRDGDIVNIAQREPNRTLWLRPGYSFFGFIKLSY